MVIKWKVYIVKHYLDNDSEKYVKKLKSFEIFLSLKFSIIKLLIFKINLIEIQLIYTPNSRSLDFF